MQLATTLVREGGLDLRCGGGRGAALTCPRHVIHSRARSSPVIQRKTAARKGDRSVWCARGDLTSAAAEAGARL